PNHKEQIPLPDHKTALERAVDALKARGAPEPEAIGHRIVHGGPKVRVHQRATARVIEELRAAVPFAPLHVPQALSVLEATQNLMPGAAQVICLDTAFHRTMPDVGKTFALPREIRDMGVERYGFHGLSLESILAQLDSVPARLIVAHLGNGASITAIHNGYSIDTTMGLTPTGGVMMGTRCGDLDPGIALYLMRQSTADAGQLEEIFDLHSGLLGVSGKGSDVRELIESRKQDTQADLALRMFCYQVRKAIAAMAAALGGIDSVVLTGGIGEHATALREEICAGLEFLGHFDIRVLRSQEDLQIARITAEIIRS
ncbi:MAG: acetate/propionate family kinase, partial [Acidobacteriaceae bacterium]|nr:acetate/propionate family kinase [Acidobacteriaceae bacterium]